MIMGTSHLKIAKDKERSLLIAALISSVLALLKLAAFIVTGSLLPLTSFFDSVADSVVSLLNFYIQAVASEEPDKEHPFGHGGIEILSSLGQALVISASAAILLYESIRRLFYTADNHYLQTDNLLFGAGILVLSSVGSLIIQTYLKRRIRGLERNRGRSLILLADHAHYTGDAKVNFCSALGMVAVWYFDLAIIDALLGALGACFLATAIVPVLRHAFSDILQREADVKTQQRIVDLAMGTDTRVIGLHRLRTRQSGPVLYADFHLKLPSRLTLEEAHQIGENVSSMIRKSLPGADIIIHLDPDSEPDDDHWSPAYQIGDPQP